MVHPCDSLHTPAPNLQHKSTELKLQTGMTGIASK